MAQQTNHHSLIYPLHGTGRQNSYPASSNVSHILQSNNAQARPSVPQQFSQEYHASSKAMRPPRIPNPWVCPQHRPLTASANFVAQTTNIVSKNQNGSEGDMLDLVAGFDNHVASMKQKRYNRSVGKSSIKHDVARTLSFLLWQYWRIAIHHEQILRRLA